MIAKISGLLFGERLDTLFTPSDSEKSEFTRPHVIGFVAGLLRIYFFPLWRADLFFSGFVVEFAGCVWTVAKSGKKKLRDSKKSGYVWTGPKQKSPKPCVSRFQMLLNAKIFNLH